MAAHLVCGFRAATRTFGEHLILQTALRGDHTRLLGILLQEGCAGGDGAFGLLASLLVEILVQQSLCLAMRDGGFGVGEHITNAFCEILNAEVFDTHAFQLLSNTQSKGITNLIHVVFLLIL